MSYQSWCVDVIADILKKHAPKIGSWEDIGYKEVLKKLITHYADVYWDPQKKRQVNMWWKFTRNDYERFFDRLLMSKDAKKYVEKWLGNSKSKKRPKIHFEHIVPKAYVFDSLIRYVQDEKECSDEEFKERVREHLAYNKIVVISKRETRSLDGAGMMVDKSDVQMLKKLKLSPKKEKYEIEEATKLLNEKAPKNRMLNDHGSALLRMCHLKRMCKSEFGYFNDLKNGMSLPMEEWVTYFDSNHSKFPPFELSNEPHRPSV